VHRASWPTAEEVVAPIGGRDPQSAVVMEHAERALGDVRRIKALLKKPVKAVIERAVLPIVLQPLTPAARDFQAAAHIRALTFDNLEESRLEFAEESGAL
jgi:hypothetical protein